VKYVSYTDGRRSHAGGDRAAFARDVSAAAELLVV